MKEVFTANTEEELIEIAKDVAKRLNGNEVICLKGELGSGKTTFVKGLAEGLGIREGYTVKSPTFTLVHEYPTSKGKLIHIDLYRDRGFDISEFIGQGIVAVEWADFLDCCDIVISIEYVLQGRKVTIIYNNGYTKEGYGKVESPHK